MPYINERPQHWPAALLSVGGYCLGTVTCCLIMSGCVFAHGTDIGAGGADVLSTRAMYQRAYNTLDTASLQKIWMGGFVETGDRGATFDVTELMESARRLTAAPETHLGLIRWTPRTVRVYAPWRIAVEMGDFTRTTAGPDGKPATGVHGVYTAQWYRGPQGWQIQAEIQSPVSCDGTQLYCGPR